VTGSVKIWLGERHFGFVKLDDGREAFCHATTLRSRGCPITCSPGSGSGLTWSMWRKAGLRVSWLALA
jgi:hypothetical protein